MVAKVNGQGYFFVSNDSDRIGICHVEAMEKVAYNIGLALENGQMDVANWYFQAFDKIKGYVSEHIREVKY